MGYEPENTLLSFETAVRMGVDGIELDVYKSKDGEMIVSHSDALIIGENRYRISKLDVEEIKKVRLKKDQEIPTLQEVFSKMEKLKEGILYSIDLKDIRAVSEYAGVIADHGLFDRVYTCLETRLFMKKAHRACEDLNLVYSTHVNPEGILEDLEKVNKDITTVINLPISEMTREILQAIKNAGLKAFTWDVNEQNEMVKAGEMDVDGIYTNFPDKLLDIIRKPIQSS